MLRNKRGDLELETIVVWILVILVLVFFLVGAFILKGKGVNALDYMRDLFRFGR
jgi:UPF0716 family protein affecting phage T7 exclusion